MVGAHDLCQPVNAKGSAYGELGEIHALLGNYEQAASCLEHQLQAARLVTKVIPTHIMHIFYNTVCGCRFLVCELELKSIFFCHLHPVHNMIC